MVLGLGVGKDEHHATAVTPAGLYPGEAKTDAKHTFIIADAARAMPYTLRAIDGEDETIAELEMIVGFDENLAGEATRVANALHGLLTDPSVAGAGAGAPVAAPGRPDPAGAVRLPGPDTQDRPTPPGRCYGRRPRGWPSDWSRTSPPLWTSRPFDASPKPRKIGRKVPGPRSLRDDAMRPAPANQPPR